MMCIEFNTDTIQAVYESFVIVILLGLILFAKTDDNMDDTIMEESSG